ncbi:MAG TPA: HU family DNA-binding protein [Blastocatellia bacterium]|nr:HU family DNA-binding protein [Blastocatellia bacterium]
MTKAELVEEVARAAELNKRDAEVIVETVFDSIITALHKGEKVELRGFGSFRTRERGPRRGRNPKTGEPVDVPAKRVPYFKPGKELKEYFTESPDGQEGSSESASSAAASAPSTAESAGAAEYSTSESSPPAQGGDEVGNGPAPSAAADGGQETAAGTEAAAKTGEGSSGEGPTA